MLIYLLIYIIYIYIYYIIQQYTNNNNYFNQNISMRRIVTMFKFSTTLQILHRNKTQLKTINKVGSLVVVKNQSNRSKLNLLPYMSINHEYITNNYRQLSDHFVQFAAYRNKLLPNQALANGEDYSEYPLQKIIQICLKHIQANNNDDKLWGILEKRVVDLFRNTSPIDNILLLYISTNRFSKTVKKQILNSISEEIKLMSQQERQFLFYTICHVTQQIKKLDEIKIKQSLNIIKQQLLATIRASKLNSSALVQWTLLISIVNAPHVNIQGVLKFYDKFHLYSNYMFNTQQFYALLLCLESRAVVAEQYQLNLLRTKGRSIIELFYSKVSNTETMIRAMQDRQRIKMKLMLSYYNRTDRLTNQEILSNTLQVKQIIRYLHWLWNNNFVELYQLKALYQSLQINLASNTNAFQNIDYVYYGCWIEMAVESYKSYKNIIDLCNSMEYIPRGLEWPVWNYLAQISKQKLITTSSQKQKIQNIINKIKYVNEKRTKQQKLSEIIGNVKNLEQIKQIQKFFHEIKAWNFTICQPVGGLDYIAHFVNHQIKVIMNCLNTTHYVEQKEGSVKQLNNEHLLNKKLLKQNFGYHVIDIQVESFVQMNYNDRIQWLRDNIELFAKPNAFLKQK